MLRKILGIEKLETENEILKQQLKFQNNTLLSIEQTAKEYRGKNCSVAYVGFEKINRLACLVLDNEIELGN